MGRKIAGFLIGLAIVAVAFSMIAVFSARDRMPMREPEASKPAEIAPEPMVVEPVREPEPPQSTELPEAAPEAPVAEVVPETVAPVTPPVAVTEPEPVTQPVEEPPVVVVEPAPQPAPAPTDGPQKEMAEPVQQVPLKKPDVLTEAPPAPQPVPPIPNPPLEVAKADPVPEPEQQAVVAPEPVRPAVTEAEPEPEEAAVQEKEPEPREEASKEAVTTPVIRRSRLPVVSDDPERSAGIQFGRPNNSSLPSVGAPEDGTPAAVPAPAALPETPAPVSPKRLVAPKSVQPEPDKVSILTVESEAPQVASEETRAIDRFGIPFDAGGKPTMSIVLVDVGNAGVTLNAAATLDLPITFAVAVDRPDATLASGNYFENGHEVLALSPRSVELSLSGGQTEEQVADLLTEFFRIVPESVGLLDVPEATLQNDRVLSNHVLSGLSRTGHGLVTYEQGLNVVKREADKADVPAGLIFRALDQKGENAEAIQRHLDRAAAEASRVGHVLVIGSTRAETIDAILAWSQSRTARNVALAPVSAGIKRD